MKTEQVTQLLQNSFLKPLMDKGRTAFYYASNILYAGQHMGTTKTAQQPNSNDVILLLQQLAELHGLSFNADNPQLLIKTNEYSINALFNQIGSGPCMDVRLLNHHTTIRRIS